ncbi:hypothetical protein HanRHA438_Chr16g0752181 [Helianthus annuus]|nr:hypothetical protein HanIR_Chr16g0804581 [Helianthus annuus]KAJ0835179.1 hypothetical protein HanRHA438_Chr16g0752181 [Helianthus annuus]
MFLYAGFNGLPDQESCFIIFLFFAVGNLMSWLIAVVTSSWYCLCHRSFMLFVGTVFARKNRCRCVNSFSCMICRGSDTTCWQHKFS